MNIRKVAALGVILLVTQFTFADASYQETSQITGGAMVEPLKSLSFLGKSMSNMFAPTNTLTMVHGNQKAVVTKESTEITDLDKETITRIDTVHKTYTVVTFAQMRQAFESHNRSRFLKLFDTRRMPGYAVFRDEVDEFFETSNSIRMNYQLTQVTTDGEVGGMMMNMTLDAAPSEAGIPGVRRDVQARFVLAWAGKGWKIADLAPRNLFKTGS